MIKYPSIEQFRNVIRFVKDRTHWQGTDENGEPVFNRNIALPKIEYMATVKIHGTNASAVLTKSDTKYQSRNNEITLEQDNAGFVNFMSPRVERLRAFFDFNDDTEIVVYGEFAGKGIQKGVAVSEVDKFFVIFGVKINDIWQDMTKYTELRDGDNRIFNIMDFKTWDLEIDFENPHLAQNEIIKITEEVEAECPAGKYFGVTGVGEGIVLTPKGEWLQQQSAWWKSKGEKHSVTKVKTLNPIDTEKLNSINELVEATVTENRLNQGLDYLREQHLDIVDRNTGAFLKWVGSDVFKEELDTIELSGLNRKDIGGAIANKARKWYMQQLG